MVLPGLSYVTLDERATLALQVTFPLVLDCYDFCTAEYKAVLAGPRGAEALIDEHRAGISKRQRLEQAAKARHCLPGPSRVVIMGPSLLRESGRSTGA